MKILLIFYCLINATIASAFYKFQIYAQLPSSKINLYTIELTSLDVQGYKGTSELLIYNSEADDIKLQGCKVNFVSKSGTWPQGMEQYICSDLYNNSTKKRTRYYQFAPGISAYQRGVGELITWKDNMNKSKLQYKILPR